MDLRVLLNYQITFSSDEFRLVNKALRGKLTPVEMLEALALQEKMMLARASYARQMEGEFAKAEEHIEAKRER